VLRPYIKTLRACCVAPFWSRKGTVGVTANGCMHHLGALSFAPIYHAAFLEPALCRDAAL